MFIEYVLCASHHPKCFHVFAYIIFTTTLMKALFIIIPHFTDVEIEAQRS